MRYFILFFITISLSFSAIAQDTENKPFTEMTLEELESVDTGALDRTEKKLHKKVLKAAKKAEKARLRAEKKRRQAEAKARKQAERERQKRLRVVNKSYEGADVVRGEFDTFITINGQKEFTDKGLFSAMSDNGVKHYHLKALINPENQNTRLFLVAFSIESDMEMNADRLKFRGIAPKEYARRQGYWRNYSRARMTGGVERKITKNEKMQPDCNSSYCTFREKTVVKLKMQDLQKALAQRGELAIQLSGEDAPAGTVRVPYGYLVGFAWRLSEQDSSFTELAAMAHDGRRFIEAGGQ